MKFLPIVWRNLMRRKIRTFFTVMTHPGGVRPLRRADGDSRGVQLRRRGRGRGSSDDDPQGVDHPAAAAKLLRRVFARRKGLSEVTYSNWFGGYFQDTTEHHPEHGGRSGELAEHVPGVRAAGRCRRPRGTRTAPAPSSAPTSRSASAGKSATGFPSSRPSTASLTARRGNSRSTASTTRPSRASTRRSSSSTTTTSTKPSAAPGS